MTEPVLKSTSSWPSRNSGSHINAFLSVADSRLLADEALVRSADSRLSNPELLFDAAERLGCVSDLSRKSAAGCQAFPGPPECLDFRQSPPSGSTRRTSPVVRISPVPTCASGKLELTERRSLDHVLDLTERVAQLRALGYRVAVDNLGAGYAGLGKFNSLEPDFAKLDMALIRNIEASKRKQSLVRSLIALCGRELGIFVVCEGVETEAERDTLESLGADLCRGTYSDDHWKLSPRPHSRADRWCSAFSRATC